MGGTAGEPVRSAWWFHLPWACFLGASPGLASTHPSRWGLSLPPSPSCVLQVKATVHLAYLRAVGNPLCLYALFLFLCQQVASFCRGYWLSLWADDPAVGGQQTQAALRGGIFGLLGCLQGTPHLPSSSPSSQLHRGVLRAPLPHPSLGHPVPLEQCAKRLGSRQRSVSLR